MVGSATETIVWSSAARNMPSISAMNTVRSAAPVSPPFSSTSREYAPVPSLSLSRPVRR